MATSVPQKIIRQAERFADRMEQDRVKRSTETNDIGRSDDTTTTATVKESKIKQWMKMVSDRFKPLNDLRYVFPVLLLIVVIMQFILSLFSKAQPVYKIGSGLCAAAGIGIAVKLHSKYNKDNNMQEV